MADTLKDQGNAEFKKGSYLKAAALYSQAVKQDPNNAVLYRLVATSLSGHAKCYQFLLCRKRVLCLRLCLWSARLILQPTHFAAIAQLPCSN